MRENLLLAVLPERERRRIAPFCETVELSQRTELGQPDAPIECVYFPHTCVLSSLIHVESGEAVEVGLIGREGMWGLPLVLGGFANPFHVIVQYPGRATRIAREPFQHDVMQSGHPFCEALFKYANLYLSMVAQTAACNRLHRIEQRLARWILEMESRAGTKEFPLTHELLGMMVGAYRPSVTNALAAMEEQGILRVSRGRVTISSVEALEGAACECYRAMQARTEKTLDRIREMAA